MERTYIMSRKSVRAPKLGDWLCKMRTSKPELSWQTLMLASCSSRFLTASKQQQVLLARWTNSVTKDQSLI